MLAADQPISWTAAAILMIIVGIVLVGSGIGVAEVARRTADGRLGPNGWAGIRTGATQSSPEAWSAAHQVGLGPTLLGARVMVASGVVSPVIAVAVSSDDADRAVAIWGVLLVAVAVPMTVLIIVGAVRGHRAAQAVQADVNRREEAG